MKTWFAEVGEKKLEDPAKSLELMTDEHLWDELECTPDLFSA